MVNTRSGAVRRLTRSAEDSALTLNTAGGVTETALAANTEVLSDDALRALARAARQLKPLLGGVNQDIEWALDAQGRVVILQSRPFIDAGAAR